MVRQNYQLDEEEADNVLVVVRHTEAVAKGLHIDPVVEERRIVLEEEELHTVLVEGLHTALEEAADTVLGAGHRSLVAEAGHHIALVVVERRTGQVVERHIDLVVVAVRNLAVGGSLAGDIGFAALEVAGDNPVVVVVVDDRILEAALLVDISIRLNSACQVDRRAVKRLCNDLRPPYGC